MQLKIECPRCASEATARALTATNTPWVDIDESGWFELECASGHKSIIGLQNLKFELLFENAAYALLDGYPREAVASFAASLERYYDFHLHVLAVTAGVAGDGFRGAWNEVKTQSERQLGAYIVASTLILGRMPPLLPKKPTDLQKLRNQVVHNGLMPTKTVAIEFGNAVLRILREGIVLLRGHCAREHSDAFARAFAHDMQKRCPAKYRNRQHSTVGVGTIVWAANASQPSANLEADLAQLALFRHTAVSALEPKPKGSDWP